MQAWRTKRRHEYSVHMTAEELAGLIRELGAPGPPSADDLLPLLARLHRKLNAIHGAKKGTRA
jgi:hypothetical protein